MRSHFHPENLVVGNTYTVVENLGDKILKPKGVFLGLRVFKKQLCLRLKINGSQYDRLIPVRRVMSVSFEV